MPTGSAGPADLTAAAKIVLLALARLFFCAVEKEIKAYLNWS